MSTAGIYFIKINYRLRVFGYGKFFFCIGILFFSIWFSAYYFSKSTKKIEFFIGNVSFTLPFSGYLNNCRSRNIMIGEIVPNCGIKATCPLKHFPIHLHFGRPPLEMPKICIGGKYVVHKNLNNTESSLNVVIIDSQQREAVSVRSFGHKENISGKELEQYLKDIIQMNDIVIVMTFDEASSKLNDYGRQQFVNLGSGMIQNLQSSYHWFMVTQKGIKGFTPYEDIFPFNEDHINVMDVRLCIKTEIKGRVITPDFPENLNHDREVFCLKTNHSDLQEFCSGQQRFTNLEPATLTNSKFIGNPIYHSPILILSGSSLDALSATLETLLSQPGINPDNVVICFNPNEIQGVQELANLFEFSTMQINETKYLDFMKASLKKIIQIFPSAYYITVIEEFVLLSPDFLQYLASTIALLHDSTVLAISAWNLNGFSSSSSRQDLLYRVEDFPGAAFATKLETLERDLLPILKMCRHQRGFESWSLPNMNAREVIIPDVSRCIVDSSVYKEQSSLGIFAMPRRTNINPSTEIKNIARLNSSNYDLYLKSRLSSNLSKMIDVTNDQLYTCIKEKNSSSILKKAVHKIFLYVIAYHESTKKYMGMKMLCQCFGLYIHPRSLLPFGLHKGVLRFTYQQREIWLLSSQSTLFLLYPFHKTSLILS